MNIFKLLIISMILGMVIASLIGFGVGIDSAVEVVLSANYFYLLVAFAFQLLAFVAMSLRWKMVVDSAGIKIGLLKLFFINLIGTSFANLTPSSRMGGEPVRAYFLNKEAKTSTKHSLATIVTERIFDATTFTLIALIVILAALYKFNLPVWVFGLLLVSLFLSFVAIALIIFISTNKKSGLKIIKWLTRKLKFLIKRFRNYEKFEKRIIRDTKMYSANVRGFLKRKDLWAYGMAYTGLVWFFDIFRTYFVFLAIGWNVDLVIIASVIMLVALAGTVPFTPGGIGLMETLMIIIYSSSGITLLAAGMSTLIDRFIGFWIFTFIGLSAAYYFGMKHFKNLSLKKKASSKKKKMVKTHGRRRSKTSTGKRPKRRKVRGHR